MNLITFSALTIAAAIALWACTGSDDPVTPEVAVSLAQATGWEVWISDDHYSLGTRYTLPASVSLDESRHYLRWRHPSGRYSEVISVDSKGCTPSTGFIRDLEGLTTVDAMLMRMVYDQGDVLPPVYPKSPVTYIHPNTRQGIVVDRRYYQYFWAQAYDNAWLDSSPLLTLNRIRCATDRRDVEVQP